MISWAGGAEVIGKVDEIDYDNNFIALKPWLALSGDGKTAYVEPKSRTKITFPLLDSEKSGVVIRPIGKKYLEDRVKEINSQPQKSKIGFER